MWTGFPFRSRSHICVEFIFGYSCFFSLLKNQHFQISPRPLPYGHLCTSSWNALVIREFNKLHLYVLLMFKANAGIFPLSLLHFLPSRPFSRLNRDQTSTIVLDEIKWNTMFQVEIKKTLTKLQLPISLFTIFSGREATANGF